MAEAKRLKAVTGRQAAPKSSRATRAVRGSAPSGFTPEERAAMKERARELAGESRASERSAEAEREVLAKIAALAEPDRTIAARLHEIIRATAPGLLPRTWYGMPAYAKDGKVLCFFQGASKFKTRYATLGFSDVARLDAGAMWPTAFALTALSPAEEARIEELLRQAIR
jgi:uncharacterized protein YdhG (YjbR/CyaY superfamily)